MADIDLPAQGRARIWLRRLLAAALAGAVLVGGASAAAAQDLNSVGFTNTSSYVGKVLSNDSSQIINSPGATWTGDILSNNNVIFNKAGATWYGDILGNGGGSNSHAQIDNTGDWFGAVVSNAGTIYNDDGLWTGDVKGNTGGIANGFIDPNQPAEWSGDVLGNSNLIINYANGTWGGDVVANTGDIANYGAWNGDLTNSGRIIHTGVWTGDVINKGTFFWAQNQIIGSFDNRGALQLTGNLSGITTLTNSGLLDLTKTDGSQTLSVASMVLNPSSSYKTNVTAAGAADQIAVTGAATLGGTVSVLAATTGGTYASPTSYTILTAGSINGSFDGVTTDLAFFAPHLSYDPTDVYLTLRRNDVGFTSIGSTTNQRSVGSTVEALLAGNSLYDAVLWLTPDEAQHAFDELSGESYASSESLALQQSILVRGMAIDRLRQAFEKPRQEGTASGYAASPVPGAQGANSGFWAQFYGSVGMLAATSNTPSTQSSTGGLAVGLDGVAGAWTVGFMPHVGLSVDETPRLGTVIASKDYGLGIYGGREWGSTRLALGADYTRHDNHSTRDVVFPGFADTLSADYAAATAQAFVELSHQFDFGALSLTPYLGLAYVNHATDGFSERGGAAALTSLPDVVDATFTTLGVRGEQEFVVADTMLLTASGSLGWSHTFGDAPGGTYALAGGSSFSSADAPIAGDVLILSAGLNLDLNETTALRFAYDGQLGATAQTHAAKLSLTSQF